jgi:hypothetical protein
VDAKWFALRGDKVMGEIEVAKLQRDLQGNFGKLVQAQLDTKTGHWTVKWARTDWRWVGERRIEEIPHGIRFIYPELQVRKQRCTSVVCYKPDQGWSKLNFEESPPGEWVKKE